MRMCCEMSPLHLTSTWAFTVCVIWTTAIGDQTPVFITLNTPTARETNTPTTIHPSTDSVPTDISGPDGHISNSAPTDISGPDGHVSSSIPTDISGPDGHVSNSAPTDRYERLGSSTQRVLETVTVTTIAGTIKTTAAVTTVVTSATVAPQASSTQPHIPHTVISPVATNPTATTSAPSRAPKKPPCCPQPTRMPTLPPHQFIGDEGDYDDESEEEEEGTEEEEEGGKLIKENLCDFDPCLHLQRPCPEVREAKGQSCRCPGLTPTSVTPDPVVALEVWGVWPEAVRVRWCAPYSAVSKFGVWALRENDSVFSNGSVSAWSRQASVFGLKAGRRYRVCVSALNGAGTSHTRCVPVSTPVGVEAVVLYVLTGLCAALGMTVVVLSVFLHRIWKMQNTHSLFDPRAHTLYNPRLDTKVSPPTSHHPRLTSLVSITNPAYTHTDEHTVSPSARYTQTDQLSTNVRNE
ncbi:leucine-rich repeat neuronal protein 4-like [Salvelinus namaycush]|uniref:Leucine-rich repeat neuronal protein 4-like n=1 Tax=Salvelinus namaycush TaxID=8040 RepID=A0A8U1BZS7_SALNM|nr:leucine-rich repeat neuronal protein 4-like [Salvelinus namaycush]